MTIISWNIHGAKNKLQNHDLLHFLCSFDIICLNEVKTPLPITIPGYSCSRSIGDHQHRGGCAIFVRNRLRVEKVSFHEESVWLKLECLPQFNIISCYIAPSDSPYLTYAPLAEVQDRVRTAPHEAYLVIGDMNARFGDSRSTFIAGKDLRPGTQYLPSPDPIATPNSNARYVAGALESLVLVNGLSPCNISFPISALTFRQGDRWISEVDLCFVSPEYIDAISSFAVIQGRRLPSDHAPITLAISVKKAISKHRSKKDLLPRASALGNYEQWTNQMTQHHHSSRRPIRMNDIDDQKILDAMRNTDLPDLESLSLDQATDTINDILYSCADTSRRSQEVDQLDPTQNRQTYNRWQQLLEGDDHKALWKAIHWNGVVDHQRNEDGPSDEAFRNHFEDLLKVEDASPIQLPNANATLYFPVTDDPVQPMEVDQAIKKLKPNKAGGPSGVPPGVLKLLPVRWIVFLAALFSRLLAYSVYPESWTISKLVTIFKKGARDICSNYRGISLMDSTAKLYDSILSSRLQLWMAPDREQAGSQKGRGCMEHLVTLRLLIDYAKYKKKKLYCVFVDFSKAYDRVPRNLIVEKLAALGCGGLMIRAVAATYKCTRMMLRTAIISANIGVRQGSPTSCFLFTMVVNDLIRNLKQRCAPDGFLNQLHSLMLMDDTILLATTRERA